MPVSGKRLTPFGVPSSPALPKGVAPNEIWGFDSATGKPKDWLLRYSVAFWNLTLKGLKPGEYELRVRTVDLWARTYHPRRVVFETGWRKLATHKVELVVLGTRGRPHVAVDRIVIRR